MTGHAIKVVTDDEGQYRWACACGQRGSLTWETAAPAQTAGDRHLLEAERAAA